jgi:hypothetical protein
MPTRAGTAANESRPAHRRSSEQVLRKRREVRPAPTPLIVLVSWGLLREHTAHARIGSKVSRTSG